MKKNSRWRRWDIREAKNKEKGGEDGMKSERQQEVDEQKEVKRKHTIRH